MRAALVTAAAALLAACKTPAPDPEIVPRDDLIRACLGFDMLVAARNFFGDTLAVDQETGDVLVIDEQTYTEADWVCGGLEVLGVDT